MPAYVKPWTKPLPPIPPSETNTAWFTCRNPMRKAMPTVCVGWRGSSAAEIETSVYIIIKINHSFILTIFFVSFN